MKVKQMPNFLNTNLCRWQQCFIAFLIQSCSSLDLIWFYENTRINFWFWLTEYFITSFISFMAYEL